MAQGRLILFNARRQSQLSMLNLLKRAFIVGRLPKGLGTKNDHLTDGLAHGPLDKVSTRLLYARQQIATRLQLPFLGHSTCGRCKWPWPLVREHSTEYAPGSGCFPLCEDCWWELQIPEWRMPYYMQWVDRWASGPLVREQVRRAVLSEGAVKS